ncbi:MAG: polymer-forming cytoskeletal protein, partial [Bacteroidota bacterium]
MFGNKKNKEAGSKDTNTSSSPKSRSLNTLVKGTNITGDIKAESDIRVDGTIKGTLECSAKVIIGATGAVEGEVKCVNAVIEGKFDGNLVVK